MLPNHPAIGSIDRRPDRMSNGLAVGRAGKGTAIFTGHPAAPEVVRQSTPPKIGK
jgi:hypothetical protein